MFQFSTHIYILGNGAKGLYSRETISIPMKLLSYLSLYIQCHISILSALDTKPSIKDCRILVAKNYLKNVSGHFFRPTPCYFE